MRLSTAALLAAALWLSGCGRYFPGPVRPLAEPRQDAGMQVSDDGTVTYVQGRLEIGLRPMRDDELNRLFPAQSSQGAQSTNPYTYGDWVPLGENYTPPRFSVFLLKIKNYAFPKVRIDPQEAVLHTQNRRTYRPLSLLHLSEYYRSHAQAWAGNAHNQYRRNIDVLLRTLFKPDIVFSGQETQGYIAFPPLPADVTSFALTFENVVLRFNYAGEPLESIPLTFRFERDVYKGYQPPAALATQK